jgi:hypothetical protein
MRGPPGDSPPACSPTTVVGPLFIGGDTGHYDSFFQLDRVF